MLKRLAPKGDLFFLHYLDVLPPRYSGSLKDLGRGPRDIRSCERAGWLHRIILFWDQQYRSPRG